MTKRYILILLLAMISLVSAEEKKKVGFYFRHFTVRGTEVASYDYADCNETILGNESYIFYVPCLPLPASDFSQEVEEKFQKRFSGRFYQCSSIQEVDSIIQDKHIDVLYNIKSGEYDGVLSQHAKNAIHAVFTIAPHGDAYAAISDWVTSCHPKSNVPVVPHMVRIGKSTSTLHKELGIPENALVLGRHGGFTTFNIPFVKELITETAKKHPTYYFIFLHTEPFCSLPNVIFLPKTSDLEYKTKFMNTCDAMIHARGEGETFGLSCGEFSLCNKPIITWANSNDRAHIEILGDQGFYYKNKKDLKNIFSFFETHIQEIRSSHWTAYSKYTPEVVMETFDKVFLTPHEK